MSGGVCRLIGFNHQPAYLAAFALLLSLLFVAQRLRNLDPRGAPDWPNTCQRGYQENKSQHEEQLSGSKVIESRGGHCWEAS
jgi:hypothetical protein